jgi:AraC-like DNA-binding protein
MPITTYCPLLFLWQQRSVFVGSLPEPIDISTGASTLMMGLDKPIRFKTSQMETFIECQSLLIPAGTSVVIDTQGAFFFNCTLDPQGFDFHSLSKAMTKNISNCLYLLEDEKTHINNFLSFCCAPLSANKIQRTLDSFLQQPLQQSYKPQPKNNKKFVSDPRIDRVISYIRNNTTQNTTLSNLAELVNVSPVYLSELFKICTGLPIRRFRLWHRLYTTIESMGRGGTLTDAAMTSGFNDSSHFIRTFRSMLGMAPSTIFMQTTPLQILTEEIIESHEAPKKVLNTPQDTSL